MIRPKDVQIFRRLLVGLLPGLFLTGFGEAVVLEGRVVATDGTPAVNARVLALASPGYGMPVEALLGGRLAPAAIATTRTGEDGAWRLEIEPGIVDLRIEAPGTVPVERQLGAVLEDSVMPDAILRPARQVTIRLRSSAGEPVAGALLTAYDGSVVLHRRDWRPPRHFARSDERGRVRLLLDEAETTLEVSALHPESGEIAATRDWKAGLRFLETRPRIVEIIDASEMAVPDAVVTSTSSGLPWGRTDGGGRIVVRVPAAGVQLQAEAPSRRKVRDTIGPAKGVEPKPFVLRLPAAGFLEGRVLDAGSGEPISEALVWPADRPSDVQISDDRGRFRLPVASGGHRLEVPGEDSPLQAAAAGYLGVFARIGPSDGSVPEEATLRLPPAASLGVEVVGPAGEPLSDVRIRGTVSARPEGTSFHSRPVTSETDADGRARLHPLPTAGTLRLILSRPGLETRQEEIVLPLPEDRAEIRLRLGEGTRLAGRVVGASGDPGAGARIHLEPHDAPHMPGDRRHAPSPLDRTAVADLEGLFEISGVSEGRWTVRIRHAGSAPLDIPGLEISENEGKSMDLGQLSLEPEIVVVGRVVDGEGRPIAGAEVGLRTSRQSGRPSTFRFGLEGRTTTDSGGSFRLGERRRGEEVDVGAFAAGFVPKVVQGLALPLTEPVEIRLEPTTSISGRVVDSLGRGIPGAQMSYRIERRRPDGSGWGSTDSLGSSFRDGTFSFENLPHGPLSLLASADGFVTGSADLELAPGERRRDVELELRRGATLRGRVLDDRGRPAAETWVAGAPADRGDLGMSVPQTVTDSHGRFVLGNLDLGRLEIEAQSPSSGSSREVVDIRPGDNDLELVLRAGYPIRGRIVDADGLSAAGATIEAVSRQHGGALFATADGDGHFEITGARAGSWSLLADHPRLGKGSLHLAVEGPTEGVRVELGPGARLHGRILGADVDELADAFLRASSFESGRPLAATIDWEGRWEIEGAGPGTWALRGRVGDHPLATEIRVEPGETEATHDFDLSEGLILEGWVHVDGEPVDGGRVQFSDSRGSGWQNPVQTDGQGRFRVTGLAEGPVRLTIRAPGIGAERRLHLHEYEFVEIEASRSRIAGRVVDGETGEGIANAGIRWEPIAPSTEEASAASTWRQSSGDGRFVFEGVPEGRIRFTASAIGYGEAEQTIPVTMGTDISDLRLELHPTEGLLLKLLEPAPTSIRVFVDGPGGGSMVVPVPPDGLVRIQLGSPGARTLRVSAMGRATVEVPVEIPSDEPIVISLPPAAPLVVETGPEGGPGTAMGSLFVDRSDGRPFLSFRGHRKWSRSLQLPLRGGLVRIDDLSPGTWTLRLLRPDGTEETTTVTTRAGHVTRHRFE